MFGRRFWTITSMYVVLIVANVPLVLGVVPPNRWYGFRLPGARFDPALWYELNAMGGRFFIAALVICAGINALIFWKGTEAFHRIIVWINVGLILLSFWLVSLELLQYLPR
ncbi:MAG TPA: SdpI family protein [bacterium]|nr:SdpI family protein [bacterium]